MADILLTNDGPIATVKINKPKIHNAFDDKLIDELTQLFNDLNDDDNVHVVVLAAQGKNFSAGADLNWMKKMAQFSQEENKADALKLATLLKTLNQLKKPTIAAIQGKVFGGGIGLIACCDIAIAEDNAQFCFSEVKLGLIPATIAPYILAKIGESATRHLFLTAETFHANKAINLNLIHQITPATSLYETATKTAHAIAQYSPEALAKIKQLIHEIHPITEAQIQTTIELLAKIRQEPTTQKLIQQFLASF